MEPLQLDGAAKTEKEVQYPITWCTIFSYSHLRLWISSMDLTLRPARTVTYVEALKMPAGRQGSLVAGCKTFDLLIGFIVGKLSDATRTQWGRRMPWVVTLFPFGMIAAVLFCSPTLWAFAPEAAPAHPCMDLVDKNVGPGCDTLKACLEASFGINGTHPSGNGPKELGRGVGGIPSNLSTMSAYFAVFYLCYYMFGWTGSMIPYDALGMELTDDGKSRSLLFGVRALAQFAGYFFIIVGLQVVAARYPGDVPLQHALLSMVFGVMGLLALVNLICGVKERPLPKTEEHLKVPVVPAIRRLFSNPQYIRYLCMQAPGRLCVLLPANLINLYCKFNLELENFIPVATIAALAIVAVSFVAAPCVTCCARAYERKNVLLTMLVVQGIGFTVLIALDPQTLAGDSPANILNLCFALFGVGLAGQSIIPEAMLADVIDYDELLTGDRNEAMYTVVETNLVQFVEVIGGVLPLLFMEFGGYVPNNACACGCGVACDDLNAPYARWVCPNDVGFNCRGQHIADNRTDFDTLLFGDLDRTAPCVAQNGTVKTMLIFFAYGAPLIFAIISGIALYMYKLTGPVHDQILLEVQRRKTDPTYQCTDPLTGKKITLPTNSEVEMFKANFSEKEWNDSQQGGSEGAVMESLQGSVKVSLMTSGGVVAAIIFAMFFVGNDYVLSLGFIALALGVCGVVWNVLRFQALQNPPSAAAYGLPYEAS